MKRVLRIGGALLGVAILIVLVLGIFNQRGAGSATAQDAAPATTVARGSIEATVSATGSVVAGQDAVLAFASSGRIARVDVAGGDRVEAGQELARLDTTTLDWQRARAQASLATAQARLAQAQQRASEADLAAAQAAVDSAQKNYDQVKAGPSQEDLTAAQLAVDSAQANYDKVTAGPTPADLAAVQAALDSARAALEQAQASYDQVKGRPDIAMLPQSLNLENATISMQQAQANYDAVANHPTASELAAAKSQLAQAKAQLAQLQEKPTASELAAAASQVAQAEAQLAQLRDRPSAEDVAVAQAQVNEAATALDQANSQLDDATIVAPFAGTILAVEIGEGEWGTPGAPAVSLAAMDPLRLDVNVDEIDVAQIAAGQTAYLSFDALQGQEIEGTVTRVAPSSTTVGGAVAYPIEVSFSAGDLAVRLGMTANVDIAVARAEDALLVPNRAITADREAGRYYVTRLLPDGTTQRLEVRIGLRDGSQTQVVEWLAEGDRVVLPEIPTQGQDQQLPGGRGGFFGSN